MVRIPRPPAWGLKPLYHLRGVGDVDACIAELNELDGLLNSQLTTLLLIFLTVAAAYGGALHRHHGHMSALFVVGFGLLAFNGIALCVSLIHTPWETRWHLSDRDDWKGLVERRARQVAGKATMLWLSTVSLIVAIVPVGWAVAATFHSS